MSEYYDARLLLYSEILNVPLQVLMLDVYNKLGKKNINAYAAMSVLGFGSQVLSAKLGQSIFRGVHKDTLYLPKESTNYYADLRTRYFYDHIVKGIYKSSHKKQDILLEEAQQILSSAPLFSEGYAQAMWALGAAYVSYKTLSANKGNIVYDLIYGLTQPICVVLKDNGTLK